MVSTLEDSFPLLGETSATSSRGWETHCFLVVCIYRNHWLENSAGKSYHLSYQVLQRHPFYSLINQTPILVSIFFFFLIREFTNRQTFHQQYPGTYHSESIDLFSIVTLPITTFKTKKGLKFFTKTYISRMKPFIV